MYIPKFDSKIAYLIKPNQKIFVDNKEVTFTNSYNLGSRDQKIDELATGYNGFIKILYGSYRGDPYPITDFDRLQT